MNRNKAIQGVLLLTMSSFFLRGIGMIYRIVRFRCLHCEGTVFPARFRRGLVIYCPKCGQPVEYL
mgnify:FL=1